MQNRTTITLTPLRQAHVDALASVLARCPDQSMTLTRNEADFLGDTWTLRVLQQAANDLVSQSRATFQTDFVGRISVHLMIAAAEPSTPESNA
jgi:hypothetical protein